MIASLNASYSLMIPLIGAALIYTTRKNCNIRELVTLLSATGLFAINLILFFNQDRTIDSEITLLEIIPNAPLLLKIEPLGLFFGLIASGLWIINSIYSIGYTRANQEKNQTRFYICFAVALSSTMGIAFAGNLITLFLFYEILTLSTYPLVAHHGTEIAQRGSRTYLGILLSTSVVFLLFAIIWTWVAAGHINFQNNGIIEKTTIEGISGLILLALFIFGFGKAAIMPFHKWLPAAMVAPTPVSALLHAVAVVKAGVFCILKVVIYIFGIDYLVSLGGINWLVLLSAFTIIAASLIALRADNLKRRLAYSTISQLSYIVLSTALLAPLALLGACLHIVAHAVSKITLFFAAGAIYTASSKTKVSELNGIGKRMPLTMVAFGVGALSLIGIPPAIGFLSKWYILSGAISIGSNFAVFVIVLSTLLNAAYFLPILYRAFFKNEGDEAGDHGEAPVAMIIAMVCTASLTIILFFFPDVLINLVEKILEDPV